MFESGRPIAHVARDLGVASETLRVHVRRVEADEGLRPDLPTAAEREEIKRLRRENFELRCWEGVVFFSFVIDVFSRWIVGWRFAAHMRTDLVADALRMALTCREQAPMCS